MAFDIEGARRAGYSDDEIRKHMESKGLPWSEAQPAQAPTGPRVVPQANTPPPTSPDKMPQVRASPIENPTTLQDIGQSAPGELARGVVGIATLPRTISDLIGGNLGMDPASIAGAGPRYPSYAETMASVEKFIPGGAAKPQTTGGKFVGTALQMLPGAGFGPGGLGAKGLQWLTGALGSESLGQMSEGTAAEPWLRALGGVGGATILPKVARSVVTPNPYNQKMLADYNAQRDFVAANTAFPEDAKFLSVINALKGGSVDVSKYRQDAFNKLTPQQQQAAMRAGSPPAPWHTGPGAAPPAPPPSWTGAQVAHMEDALRRDIAKGGPNVPQLTMLQKAHDEAMKRGTAGTPFEGAWAGVKKQRAGLDKEVDDRLAAAGGGPGKALGAAAGGVLLNMLSHKAGLPGWGLEAMLTAAGGLGGAGAAAKASKYIPSFKDMIPGVADYRRNQLWQPGGPATTFSPMRTGGMLGSGELIFPALAYEPPK